MEGPKAWAPKKPDTSASPGMITNVGFGPSKRGASSTEILEGHGWDHGVSKDAAETHGPNGFPGKKRHERQLRIVHQPLLKRSLAAPGLFTPSNQQERFFLCLWEGHGWGHITPSGLLKLEGPVIPSTGKKKKSGKGCHELHRSGYWRWRERRCPL